MAPGPRTRAATTETTSVYSCGTRWLTTCHPPPPAIDPVPPGGAGVSPGDAPTVMWSLHGDEARADTELAQRRGDLVDVDRVHRDHEPWPVVAEEPGCHDLLAGAGHEHAVLVRVDVDRVLDLRPQAERREERHALG